MVGLLRVALGLTDGYKALMPQAYMELIFHPDSQPDDCVLVVIEVLLLDQLHCNIFVCTILGPGTWKTCFCTI